MRGGPYAAPAASLNKRSSCPTAGSPSSRQRQWCSSRRSRQTRRNVGQYASWSYGSCAVRYQSPQAQHVSPSGLERFVSVRSKRAVKRIGGCWCVREKEDGTRPLTCRSPPHSVKRTSAGTWPSFTAWGPVQILNLDRVCTSTNGHTRLTKARRYQGMSVTIDWPRSSG